MEATPSTGVELRPQRRSWLPKVVFVSSVAAAFGLGFLARGAAPASFVGGAEPGVERTFVPAAPAPRVEQAEAAPAAGGQQVAGAEQEARSEAAQSAEAPASTFVAETNAATGALNLAALEEIGGRAWVEDSAPPLGAREIAVTNAATRALTLESLDDVGALGPDDQPNPTPVMEARSFTRMFPAP